MKSIIRLYATFHIVAVLTLATHTSLYAAGDTGSAWQRSGNNY